MAFLRGRVRQAPEATSEHSHTVWLRLRRFATTQWLAWDWAFGVLIPLTFLFIDPWVFRSEGGKPLLAEYRGAAYLFIIQNAVVLGLWMASGPTRGHLWIAGAFFGSAVGALAIGMALLPISGLMILLLGGGLLGLVPFVTAATFVRRAAWAVKAGRGEESRIIVLGKIVVGALLALGPALVFQLVTGEFQIPESVMRILR
jgi:hypothetical protein